MKNKSKLKFGGYFFKILLAVSIFIIFYIISRIIKSKVEKIKDKNKKMNKYSKILIVDFLTKLVSFIFIFAGLLIGLGLLGFNLSTIIVVLASIGLAFALCLKDLLSKAVAGVAIISMGYYKLGDLIVIGKDMGYVTEFDLLNTVITTQRNIPIRLPNNTIFDSVFSNLSKNSNVYAESQVCISNLNTNINYTNLFKQLKERIEKLDFVKDGLTKSKILDISMNGTKVSIQANVDPQDYPKKLNQLQLTVRDFFSENNILLCDNSYMKYIK